MYIPGDEDHSSPESWILRFTIMPLWKLDDQGRQTIDLLEHIGDCCDFIIYFPLLNILKWAPRSAAPDFYRAGDRRHQQTFKVRHN